MELNESHFERIARSLDGQDVALSAEEAALAQQIRRREAALGELLDVGLPAQASGLSERFAVTVTSPLPADVDTITNTVGITTEHGFSMSSNVFC